ncbi:carbon storage regulator CsrA [Serpentinicella sp. ANB-PHB4]|uniref:carbon storage regulator CsrA n=1 Tax=Serpentinicella sp. ANB-PHB4 TaxID=3074076 RepID=UPI0028558986|nr:carbon storage regulator CsrA [Serpentinicella sp. ANB-PHB4]MDR5659774.1 carbon storage regulator CsrA [Serpentinicella sp. ANB-PHB4]
MLVLTRKADEGIIIGKDIELKILAIEEGKVKLGISAPKEVEIFRKEIYLEIEEENKSASSQQVDLTALKNILIKK